MGCCSLQNTYSLNAVTLAITNNSCLYLAVGMSDGSLQILTYNLAAQTNQLSVHVQISLLLQTWCYMHCELDVRELGDDDYLWPEDERFFSLVSGGNVGLPPPSQYSFANNKSAINGGRRGRCMSLAWIQHDSLTVSSLLLLAAAFSCGIAIYHIATPPIQAVHKQQHQSSVVPRILPLAQSKFVSFVDESDIETASKATQSLLCKPYAKRLVGLILDPDHLQV
jgi:hypothetical protein